MEKVREREVSQFAAVCIDRDRLDILVEEHKKQLRNQRVTADLLILWPGAQIYLSMVTMGSRTQVGLCFMCLIYLSYVFLNILIHTSYWQYWQIGPEGQRNLLDGPSAMATFRELAVFETRDFGTCL